MLIADCYLIFFHVRVVLKREPSSFSRRADHFMVSALMDSMSRLSITLSLIELIWLLKLTVGMVSYRVLLKIVIV